MKEATHLLPENLPAVYTYQKPLKNRHYKNFNMKKLLIFIIILAGCSAMAQDAYHTNLQAGLQNEYSLPASTWVLPNTEQATLAAAWNYGLSASEASVSG